MAAVYTHKDLALHRQWPNTARTSDLLSPKARRKKKKEFLANESLIVKVTEFGLLLLIIRRCCVFNFSPTTITLTLTLTLILISALLFGITTTRVTALLPVRLSAKRKAEENDTGHLFGYAVPGHDPGPLPYGLR